MTHDPLLRYEQIDDTRRHRSRKISKTTRAMKFIVTYFVMTGCIFASFMGVLNFSAYSAIITHWVNPNRMMTLQDDMEQALMSSSIEIHAADMNSQNSLETITDQLTVTDPDIVYARSYNADKLLSGMSRTTRANFSVTPYENRIIIPKLAKNIPLLDVDHDAGTKFGEMQDIFMEELKKGVVRYPGTARPGEVGNAFIFGHSSNYPWVISEYNDVFALLNTLETGDEVIVYYNQHKYTYKITDRSIVKPGDTKVLSARDPNKKEISLMTCWPVGTTLERYIIFGELIENQ
jgi:LPXTG-site transpeptidase (sortase) family protein